MRPLPAPGSELRAMTAQGFGHPRRCYRRKPRGRADQVIDFCGWSMVGGRGIEPLTPSMSRKCSPQKLNRISRRSVRPSLFVHICSRISWAFHGRVAPGERGHRMAQMVMRMMAIRASDHVLGGTQHPCHVVHTHSELQQHRGAGVPQDCLLYTSPSPRDRQKSRMPSSA